MKKSLFIICALFASTSLFAQKQMQNEVAGRVTYTSDKIMQLADAIPTDKYDWSPEDGVRSVAGVFQHVIQANYFFATKLGATLPSGVNMQTLEQDLNSKEKIKPALKQSTDLIISTIKNVDDGSLGNKVEFPFPGDYTTTTAMLIAMSHCDEHLGQLIAYSRMNGITPPWSEK